MLVLQDSQPYMIIILSLTSEKKISKHDIWTWNAEAVSVTSQTTKIVRCTLDKCRDPNFLTDIFTVTHWLSKLSSSSIAVLACMSPTDGISLTFFQKYLKKSQIENKNFLCIPLCDVCNKAIVVYVDSLYEIIITRSNLNSNWDCLTWWREHQRRFLFETKSPVRLHQLWCLDCCWYRFLCPCTSFAIGTRWCICHCIQLIRT